MEMRGMFCTAMYSLKFVTRLQTQQKSQAEPCLMKGWYCVGVKYTRITNSTSLSLTTPVLQTIPSRGLGGPIVETSKSNSQMSLVTAKSENANVNSCISSTIATEVITP